MPLLFNNLTAGNFVGGTRKNIALLGAFCLFLSAVEYMIPKPLPFLRIGLANLPVMLACDILPFPAFLILIFIKVIGQALITGTLFSYIFLFSFAGTILSALFMFFLRRVFGKDKISFIGIGTAGAFISNISQLSLAQFLIFQDSTRYIAPPFLAVGIVTGIGLGIFCEVFIKKSDFYKKKLITTEDTENTEREKNFGQKTLCNSVNSVVNSSYYFFSAKALFVAGLLIMPALLFNPSTELRVVQFLFFLLLTFFFGRKINLIITFFVIIFIVAFNLIIPYGRVLFEIGAFKVTQGALTAGIHRAVTLYALIMLSKFTIRSDLRLPGSFGEILSESLKIFSILTSRKYRITGKNFIKDIDNLMIEISDNREQVTKSREQGAEGSEQGAESKEQIRTKPIGFVILIIVVAVSWVPWIF